MTPTSPVLSPISESARRRVAKGAFPKKEQLRCMMCGGKDCARCGLNAYKQLSSPAIELLHSSWITEDIIGMQRPNDEALEAGALYDMERKKITAVFNLTEPGEHPYCGTGVLPDSGFPYSPEKLMGAGIKHFNFSWRDMTVPTMQMMLDIVNIACNEIANGGKIAVHCHAGYGRTGITIACVLIAKDHLEASSVIQFVRNRRPGSIQTNAQQQFVHKFEKSFQFIMQVFPVLDEQLLPHISSTTALVDSSQSRNAENSLSLRNNVPLNAPQATHTAHAHVHSAPPHTHAHHRKHSSISLYAKSIAQSVKDQQYFLSLSELHSKDYTYTCKLIIFTANAIAKLAKEQFVICCLALTGLTKLNAKNTADTRIDERINVARADQVVGIANKTLRKKSNFVLATNALSASSEERLLMEIKLELNKSIWTKLLSYGEVLGANFKRGGDSFGEMSKLLSQRSMKLASAREKSAKKMQMSPRALPPPHPSSPPLQVTHSVLHAHAHPHTHPHDHTDHQTHSPDATHDNNMTRDGQATSATVTTSPVEVFGSSPREEEKAFSPRQKRVHLHALGKMEEVEDLSGHQRVVVPPRTRAESEGFTQLETHHKTTNLQSHSHTSLHNSSLHKHRTATSSATEPIDHVDKYSHTHANTPLSHNRRDPSSNQHGSTPNVKAAGLSSPATERRTVVHAEPLMPDAHQSSMTSLSKSSSATSTLLEKNSSKSNNSSASPSKERGRGSRTVPSFTNIKQASSLKMNSEADYSKSKTIAANTVSQLLLDWLETRQDAIFSRTLIKSLTNIWKNNGKATNHNRVVTANRRRAPSDMDELPPLDAERESTFVDEISFCLRSHLDRYKLELLDSLVIMYRTIRVAGIDFMASKSADGAFDPDTFEGCSEGEALEALVCLRLSIAAMHARKQVHGVVKNRALSMDIVKVFLLKSSHSETLLINNIPFSEDNYQQIENSLGGEFLCDLDVVFRTLRLLSEEAWSASQCRKGAQLGSTSQESS